MLNLSDLQPFVKDFLQRGLVISPWLAGVDAKGRLDPDAFSLINQEARQLSETLWTNEEQIRTFGGLPILDRIGRTAVYEILASTAVSLAHRQLGQLTMNNELVQTAIADVRRFVGDYGLGVLIRLYSVATGYENMQALNYYGAIPEREFILGQWHRPWVDYSLDDELRLAVSTGYYRIRVSEDGQRLVELTEYGDAIFEQIEALLKTSGYLEHRIRQLHISRFNLFFDYDRLAEEISPGANATRKQFLDWLPIRPGMNVLELGCADGVLAFEGGLAERIGPTGRLMCVDPSAGMLHRAEVIRQRTGMDWVQFHRGQAEQIPFPDDTFDIVLGVAFLHFTELPAALTEMRRVTRPGGIVASAHPLRFSLVEAPFFRDWFDPILQSAARRNERPRTFLSTPERITQAFQDADLTVMETKAIDIPGYFHDADKVINHFIHGVGLFQEELATLPWKARQDLILQLKQRGEVVTKTYPASDLILNFPMQFLHARK